MWQSASILFAADHPTAAGHFPGNPIIPGASILDEVVAAVAGGRAIGVRSTKFLAPVRPGARLTLRWDVSPGSARFECWRDGVLAVSGVIELDTETMPA